MPLYLRHCLSFLFLGFFLAAVAPGPSAAQDGGAYEKGLAAYNSGQFQQALDIWVPLAEAGDPIAQYSLGKLFEVGGPGVPQDYVKAIPWYEKAAAQGVPAAQNNLGLLYAQGRGVAPDKSRAAGLWKMSAEQNHPIAQYNLGLAYFRGDGIAEDRDLAVNWFKRAANGGLADAQFAMGQVRRLGLHDTINEAEALHWYQLAAEQGHEEARAQARDLRSRGIAAAAPAAPVITVSGANAGETSLESVAAAQEAEQAAAEKAAAEKAAAEKAAAEQAAAEKAAAEQAAAEKAAAEKAAAEQAAAEKVAAEQAAAQQAAQAAAIAAASGTGESGTGESGTAASGSGASESSASGASAGLTGTGDYAVWLRSEKSRANAELFLEDNRSRHGGLWQGLGLSVKSVSHGDGGTFFRVLAGNFTDRAAALSLCERLQKASPRAFCKPLAN